jgi:FkbM family methyltransferase
LEALEKNDLASNSILYIIADGPKENANPEALQKIEETRKIIKSRQWCKEVIISEKEKNSGLADSIISGVTEVVNKHGKVIVLEDDIVTSKGFLKYMNDALTLYQNEKKVMHVSGYMFPVKGKLPTTFFYKQTSCWGWATWSDKWRLLNTCAIELFEDLNKSKKIKFADIDGTNQFINQLKSNIEGKIKTWAVLWHFSVFMNDGLSLHPKKSLVRNIGHDGSGENCSKNDFFNTTVVDYINLKKVKVADNEKIYKKLVELYQPSLLKKKNSFSIKEPLRQLSPPFIWSAISRIKTKLIKKPIQECDNSKKPEQNQLFPPEEEKRNEDFRINALERFSETETLFLNHKLKIIDNASYQFIKKELFDLEIYKFKSKNEVPYIIDCGANIGLSIIYFKQIFPNAEIVGFEPDEKVFEALQFNVASFELTGVTLIKKACWDEETRLKFYSEGADAGRAAINSDTENIIEVPTIRLRDFLKRKVDFLKIDIEGAEAKVLADCADLLINVEKIFVEYHSFIGIEQPLPEILSILKNAGFRLHVSAPGLASNNPFIELRTHTSMDNQLNIFGNRINNVCN